MPEFLKRAFEYIRTTLANMSGAQRLSVGILVVAIVAAIVWAATSVASEGWVQIAGPDVPPEERGQIIAGLKERKIAYEVRGEGVYVPKAKADEVVVELHTSGTFSDASLWKFLDEGDLTSGKWQKEKRYQVALQRKLERMIRGMKMVRRASVQLAPGEMRQALGFRGTGPTASVMVELAPGKRLTRRNAEAIARLVAAGSFSGMKPHDVRILDTDGALYGVARKDESWHLAENRREMEAEYERAFKEKILAIFPEARVSVTVEVSNELRKEREETGGKPIVVESRTAEEKDKSNNTAAAPGIKQAGREITGGVTGQFKMDKESSEAREKSYIPRKVIERQIDRGEVRAKFATVYLPVYLEEGAEVQKRIQEDQGKLEGYKQAVMTAIGLKDPAALTVSLMPVRKPGEPPRPTTGERALEFFREYGGTLLLLLVALVALYIIYRLLKQALPKGVVEELQSLRRKVTEEVALPEGELTLAEEEVDRLKRSVREMAQKSPRSIASILKRWMTGK